MKYKGKDFNMWDAWYLNVGEVVHAFHLKSQPGEWNVGHVYTRDLLHFNKCEDILKPLGDKNPQDCLGKFTGCAYTDRKTGRHYVYYTMRNKIGSEKIGAAYTDDLVDFELYEKNPVLVPDGDVFYLPGEDRKTDCRDMLVVYDAASERYYGYFAAMAYSDGVHLKGVIGAAESTDLIHWCNQTIVYQPKFNGAVEVPDVFFMEGKWYMTILTGANYGAKGAAGDNNLVNFTLYASSDSPRGPFVEQDDNIFIGGAFDSGYSCRSVEFKGRRYSLYIDRSEYGAAISLPKEIKVKNGKLRPCYTPILEQLRTGRKTSAENAGMFTEFNSSFAWATDVRDIGFENGVLKINSAELGYQNYYMKEVAYPSVELVYSLTCNCGECGVMLITSDDTREVEKYYITADILNKELCVYRSGYILCSKRKYDFRNGREYFFRVIAQEGQFEIYIEDELILQGSMLTAEKIMPGLVCGRGNAEIKNFTVYELEK